MGTTIEQSPTLEEQPPPRSAADVNGAAPTTLAAYRREREAARPHSFPHLGLWGPPGTGKTQLTSVIAFELAVPLVEALGCSLAQPQAVNRLLVEASDGTVIFVDEADEMPQESQSILLRAVEERVLFVNRTDGQITRVPLASFTLALASNRMHQVLPALRDRLHLNLQFEFYDADVLATVCGDRADRLGWKVDEAVTAAVGRCGRGTPRQALRLLAACWRVACAEGAERITHAHFHRACDLEDIDAEVGLDQTERDYLRMLHASNVPVRPGVLASRLALPMRQVTEVTEAMLVRLGLIVRVPEGRGLTPGGTELCRRLARQTVGGVR